MKKFLLTFIFVFCFSIFFSTSSKAADLQYFYDSNNQLIGIGENGKTLIQFDYDLNGNLLSQSYIPLTLPTKAYVKTDPPHVNSGIYTILWDSGTGASSYDIFLNNVYYANTINNSIMLKDLIPNTSYRVEIKPKSIFNQSDNGLIISFKTDPVKFPPNPDPDPCPPGNICIGKPGEPISNTVKFFNTKYNSHIKNLKISFYTNFTTPVFVNHDISKTVSIE